MGKKIVLTGGGTAGHVNPNLALIPLLKAHGLEISYIGSERGIEKELVGKTALPFFGISCKAAPLFQLGKLFRCFSNPQGLFPIQKNPQKNPPGYSVLQGRLCERARRIRGK